MAVVARKRGHGTTYYVSFFWRGKRIWERSGPDKREAERLERRRLAEVKAETFKPQTQGVMKVDAFARAWLDKRRTRCASEEESYLRRYVLSRDWFSCLPVAAVRPGHIRQLVEELKVQVSPTTTKVLAGKTVGSIYGIVRTMFRDARIEELIDSDPCVLPRGMVTQKSRTRRQPYVAADLRALIEGDAVHPAARMFIALALYTGMREGEICGRRWRDWERGAQPLGCLTVHSQYNDQVLKTEKTRGERPRMVPVHPELARALDAWWSRGFEDCFFRAPTLDDFIVPVRDCAGPHSKSSAYKMWRKACTAARVTNGTLHAMRHTFITLCRRGGARAEVVERITHNAVGSIVDAYTHWDWSPLCEAVLCLRVEPSVEGGGGGEPGGSGPVPTVDATVGADAFGSCLLGGGAENRSQTRDGQSTTVDVTPRRFSGLSSPQSSAEFRQSGAHCDARQRWTAGSVIRLGAEYQSEVARLIGLAYPLILAGDRAGLKPLRRAARVLDHGVAHPQVPGENGR